MHSVFVGYDTKESEAFSVCRHSLLMHQPDLDIRALRLDDLRGAGLYRRPTSFREGRLWDDRSEAFMSTEHANSRFLVPHLAGREGWAMFMDCDIISTCPVMQIFEQVDSKYAVMCVKHEYDVSSRVKMNGQEQMRYNRKNWSSVMLFNCEHPSNDRLTAELINTVPGRDLHRYCWLSDHEIGALDPKWNWLVGHSSFDIEPALIHYTEGLPSMLGYENCAYSNEWREMRSDWLGSTIKRVNWLCR